MSHGIYNTRYITSMTETEERQFLQESIEMVEEHTGEPLLGMLAPAVGNNLRTPDLLAEAGLLYHADWMHDDQPVPLRVRDGSRFVSVPYSIELNDVPVFLNNASAQDFLDAAIAQFDTLYSEAILESRELGTRHLVQTILALDTPPQVVVSASAVGFYGDRGADWLDETSDPGTDFLAEVCKAWEKGIQGFAIEEIEYLTGDGVWVSVGERVGIGSGLGAGHARVAIRKPFNVIDPEVIARCCGLSHSAIAQRLTVQILIGLPRVSAGAVDNDRAESKRVGLGQCGP